MFFRDTREAAYLHPATERKRQETEKLRAINAAFRDVMRRKEAHLVRMRATLAPLRVERQALDAALEQVSGAGRSRGCGWIRPAQRDAWRRLYNFRCGYCGVNAVDSGTLDHLQPRSQSGTDEVENLVYCGQACAG